MIARVACATALLAAGCLDAYAPDVGPLTHAPCSNDDSDPSVDVHFRADVLDGVFRSAAMHCLRCHSATGQTPIGLAVSGLDLSSYEGLVAGGRDGVTIVAPGRPCDGALLGKLGEAPPFGARMPLDGPPFVTDAELRVVSDWIAEGAHDD